MTKKGAPRGPHYITNLDMDARMGDCPTCGPGVKVTNKGGCWNRSQERIKAKGVAKPWHEDHRITRPRRDADNMNVGDCPSCGIGVPITPARKCRARTDERLTKRRGVMTRAYAGKEGTTILTLEEIDAMMAGAVCEICGTGENLVIDHCHTSGEVRGILCRLCNLAIGHFQDSISSLEGAIAYLRNDNRTS